MLHRRTSSSYGGILCNNRASLGSKATMKGRWTYLYRAVDKQGRTVDFLLSERRNVAPAKRFFRKAVKSHPRPRVITLDSYAASHRCWGRKRSKRSGVSVA